MTISRRRLLASGAVGSLALTAGCVDVVLGNEPYEFAAARAAPTDAALEETGYVEEDVEQDGIEEPIDVGVEREFRATFWISNYGKEVEVLGERTDAGFFTVVSMPAIEIFGRTFNPIEDLNHEELIEEFEGDLTDDGRTIRNVRHDGSITLTILGDEREVDVFLADMEVNGQEVTIELLLTAVTHEDDLILLVGGYPEQLPDEGANVEHLMESVEHPL